MDVTSKKIVVLYRVQLIVSITLFVVVVALRVERDPLTIIYIFIGSILGTFVLDLDYIIHAYFMEPASQLSGMIKGYMKHRDYRGLFNYIHYHKDELPNKTLNSALFQIVLAALTIFTLSSNTGIFIKALVLSAFLNSIYRLLELYTQGKAAQWFWSLNIKTNGTAVFGFLSALAIALLYAISIF